jgi:hypothetical protein
MHLFTHRPEDLYLWSAALKNAVALGKPLDELRTEIQHVCNEITELLDKRHVIERAFKAHELLKSLHTFMCNHA